MEDWYTEYDREIAVGVAREVVAGAVEFWASISPAVEAWVAQVHQAFTGIGIDLAEQLNEAFSSTAVALAPLEQWLQSPEFRACLPEDAHQ